MRPIFVSRRRYKNANTLGVRPFFYLKIKASYGCLFVCCDEATQIARKLGGKSYLHRSSFDLVGKGTAGKEQKGEKGDNLFADNSTGRIIASKKPNCSDPGYLKVAFMILCGLSCILSTSLLKMNLFSVV